jgi:hypothetical protein
METTRFEGLSLNVDATPPKRGWSAIPDPGARSHLNGICGLNLHSRASIHGVQSLSKTVPWTRCFTRRIMCAGAEGGRHYGPRKLAAEPWPRTV